MQEEQRIKSSKAQIRDIEERTAAIETAREQKRIAREEKQFNQQLAKRQYRRERMVAPFLLILTVLVSLFFWWRGR